MKSISLLTFFLLLSGCASVKHPVNLGEAKENVRDYYESGAFENECSNVVDGAIKFLESKSFNEQACAVFDIDETVLSNYKYTKDLGFGYTQSSWDEWQQKGISPAIKASRRLYNYLLSKKIHIIFLTGRELKYFEATKNNLINAGFTKFDSLIVRAAGEEKIPAAEFKSDKRKALVNKGFNIVASVGDQESDFYDGNTGYIIRIPNYLYLLD